MELVVVAVDFMRMLLTLYAVHAVQPCLTALPAHPAPTVPPVALDMQSIHPLFNALPSPAKSVIATLAMLLTIPSARSAIQAILSHLPIHLVRSDAEMDSSSLGLSSAMMEIPTVEMVATLPVRFNLDFLVILSTSMQCVLTLIVSTQVPFPFRRYG